MPRSLHSSLDAFFETVMTRGPAIRAGIAAAAGIAALLGILNLAPHFVSGHPRAIPVDFSAFWAAGKAWASGASPYSEAYLETFKTYGVPHLHDAPPPYFYPPGTILLTLGLGLFSYGEASALFAWFNFVSFLMAAWLFAVLFAHPKKTAHKALYGALYLCVCGLFWKAGEVVFFHNTPAFLFYAAFLACLVGVKTKSNILVAAGLFVSLMKPQFGAPLLAAGLLLPQTRMASLAAIIATGAASLAGLAAGAPQSLFAFLGNITDYGAYAENAPLHVSGFGYLVYAVSGLDISKILLLVTSLALIAFAARFSSLDRGSENWPLAIFVFAAISSSFIFPSHNNYYLILAPALLLTPAQCTGRAVIMMGALATMFAWDISGAAEAAGLGYLQLNTALIDTLAIGAIFIVSFKSMQISWSHFLKRFTPTQHASLT